MTSLWHHQMTSHSCFRARTRKLNFNVENQWHVPLIVTPPVCFLFLLCVYFTDRRSPGTLTNESVQQQSDDFTGRFFLITYWYSHLKDTSALLCAHARPLLAWFPKPSEPGGLQWTGGVTVNRGGYREINRGQHMMWWSVPAGSRPHRRSSMSNVSKCVE